MRKVGFSGSSVWKTGLSCLKDRFVFVMHCNWRVPSQPKHLIFLRICYYCHVLLSNCPGVSQLTLVRWDHCVGVWEECVCVPCVSLGNTKLPISMHIYTSILTHWKFASFLLCVTIAVGQILLIVVAKLTQPGLSMCQQCSPQKSADFQSLASMYWCGICPHHMTIAIPFKEGTMPGLQPQGGLCTLQEQPRGNTGWYVILSIVACNGTCYRHCIDSWIARLIMRPDWCGKPFCIPITSADRNVMFILPIAPCYCSERVLRLSPLISSMFSAMCCGKGNATCVSGMSQELMCDSTVYICLL